MSSVAAIFGTIPKILRAVPAVFGCVTKILSSVANVFLMVAQTAVMTGIPNVFVSVSNIFLPIPSIFGAVPAVFGSVANILPVVTHARRDGPMQGVARWSREKRRCKERQYAQSEQREYPNFRVFHGRCLSSIVCDDSRRESGQTLHAGEEQHVSALFLSDVAFSGKFTTRGRSRKTHTSVKEVQ
jgi:hypothetical protein